MPGEVKAREESGVGTPTAPLQGGATQADDAGPALARGHVSTTAPLAWL